MRELNQYKHELLVACIEFVLSVPIELHNNQTKLVAEALKTALHFGLTHFELAGIALSTMEHWEEQNHAELLKIAPSVFTAFDKYLRLEEESDTSKTGKRSRNSKLVLKKELKSLPLIELQHRILTLVGKVCCARCLEACDGANAGGRRWSLLGGRQSLRCSK